MMFRVRTIPLTLLLGALPLACTTSESTNDGGSSTGGGATEGLTGGATEGLTGGATEGLTGGATEGLTGGATEGLTGGATEGLTGGATEGLTGGETEGLTGGETEGLTGGETGGETHVIIADCGIELACEPLTVVLGITPADAEQCANALLDNDLGGLLSLEHYADGDPLPPFAQVTLAVLTDGSVLQQIRYRDCGDVEACADGPWLPWGPHQLCDAPVGDLQPEVGLGRSCVDVADWSCEAVVAGTTVLP